MSKFKIKLTHPVDIPANPYKNLGIDKEIKALEKSIKGAEQKLYDGKPGVDEDQLKKDKERLEYLEKIKELKKRKSEAEKKAKQAEKDGEEVSEDTIILEYEKGELKKLEEESHKKPKSELMLSSMERVTWQMFLPTFYSNASFSEKKLSDFPHKLPGDLLKEWSDLKSVSAFKDYEIRASAPETHSQYFALFGFRDNAECWLIAHWHGSQTCEPFDITEIEDQCIEKLNELTYRRSATGIMAVLSFLVGIPSVLALTSHWMAGGIGTGIAVLLFALSMAWRQELDTTFSPKEEAELLSYLQKRRNTKSAASPT